MEQYNSIQQILKKENGHDRKPIYPSTVIQAVFDAKTGASLEAILAQFNSIYVQYQGSPQATRNIIPVEMRRAGLMITYMNMDSETITEKASSAVQKDNDHWGLDVNWSRVDELSLSGDIAVSAQGTWIINGVDTKVPARGSKGDAGLTPWLKTINNKLNYSYDNVNWTECSDNIAHWFRINGNKLQISSDQVLWEDVSDYIASYFRFNATSSDSQAGTIGKIQISRDNKTWQDLSPEFRNYLRIQGYVSSTSALPKNQVVGTIYGVNEGTNTYSLHVWDGSSWVNNGTFTSIAAGVVQETGNSETEVMSQKAVTEKLSELGSKIDSFAVFEENESSLSEVKIDSEGKVVESTDKNGNKRFYGNVTAPNLAEKKEVELKQDTLVYDDKPTKNSKNAVNSGAIESFVSSFNEFEDDEKFASVLVDENGKLVESMDKTGMRRFHAGIGLNDSSFYDSEFEEYAEVKIDNKGKIIEALDKNGNKIFFGDVFVKGSIKGKTINQISVSESFQNFELRTRNQRSNAASVGKLIGTYGNVPAESSWIEPLVFLHISDTHSYENELQYKGGKRPQVLNAVNCLNMLSGGTSVLGNNAKFLLHTGDVLHSHAKNDFTHFIDAVKLTDKPVFLAIGNHDVGNGTSINNCLNDREAYEKYVAPFLDNWDLNTNNDGVSNPNGKCYYFKDFDSEKIRMIVLYEFETEGQLNPNDSTSYLYDRRYRAFSQEQLDWLINSLMTTPENYGVMIVKHQHESYTGYDENEFNSPYYRGMSNQVSFVDVNIIADIVQAFIDGSYINKSYEQTGGIVTTLNVNADFSTKNNDAEFVCYISGHNHCDRVSSLKDYPKQIELNIGADNTHYIHSSDIAQIEGTISEDLINVYAVNRNDKSITICRVGANRSCFNQHRDMTRINYKLN